MSEPTLEELLYGKKEGQAAAPVPGMNCALIDHVRFEDIRDCAYGGAEGFFAMMRWFVPQSRLSPVEEAYRRWLNAQRGKEEG